MKGAIIMSVFAALANGQCSDGSCVAKTITISATCPLAQGGTLHTQLPADWADCMEVKFGQTGNADKHVTMKMTEVQMMMKQEHTGEDVEDWTTVYSTSATSGQGYMAQGYLHHTKDESTDMAEYQTTVPLNSYSKQKGTYSHVGSAAMIQNFAISQDATLYSTTVDSTLTSTNAKSNVLCFGKQGSAGVSSTPGTCGENGNNWGTALANMPITTTSACECQAECEQRAGCGAWTWSSGPFQENGCWLRESFAAMAYNCGGDCMSGSMTDANGCPGIHQAEDSYKFSLAVIPGQTYTGWAILLEFDVSNLGADAIEFTYSEQQYTNHKKPTGTVSWKDLQINSDSDHLWALSSVQFDDLSMKFDSKGYAGEEEVLVYVYAYGKGYNTFTLQVYFDTVGMKQPSTLMYDPTVTRKKKEKVSWFRRFLLWLFFSHYFNWF